MRIELTNKGFADLCLTTWLPRRNLEGLGFHQGTSLRTIPRGARRSQFGAVSTGLVFSSGNHRQQNMRRILPRMINDLLRLLQRGLVSKCAPGVRIAIEARKITARNLEADRMPGQESVTRHAGMDGQWIHLARLRQFGLASRERSSAPAHPCASQPAAGPWGPKGKFSDRSTPRRRASARDCGDRR